MSDEENKLGTEISFFRRVFWRSMLGIGWLAEMPTVCKVGSFTVGLEDFWKLLSHWMLQIFYLYNL
jgi:hypothetical protein